MKKKFLSGIVFVYLLINGIGISEAALVQIGLAYYNDGVSGTNAYNLIYDDDLQITWLDYTHAEANHNEQQRWAASLNSPGQLSYSYFSGIIISGSDNWRLPSTIDGYLEYGYNGTTTSGYNISTSEMGHLYYNELKNLAYLDTNGSPQVGTGLENMGLFNNLREDEYWSDTVYAFFPNTAWEFGFAVGNQGPINTDVEFLGLAVRPGHVSIIPLPGAVGLIFSGLIGLIGFRRHREKKCNL